MSTNKRGQLISVCAMTRIYQVQGSLPSRVTAGGLVGSWAGGGSGGEVGVL